MPILVVGLFAKLYENFSLGAELVGLFLWENEDEFLRVVVSE